MKLSQKFFKFSKGAFCRESTIANVKIICPLHQQMIHDVLKNPRNYIDFRIKKRILY
jgi:hypothetical protein